MGYMTGSGVGIAQPGRFGTMVPNVNRPGGGNAINPVNSPNATPVPWYESGAFWTLLFLFVGYVAVYRTLR